jgi:hypothetical protein
MSVQMRSWDFYHVVKEDAYRINISIGRTILVCGSSFVIAEAGWLVVFRAAQGHVCAG